VNPSHAAMSPALRLWARPDQVTRLCLLAWSAGRFDLTERDRLRIDLRGHHSCVAARRCARNNRMCAMCAAERVNPSAARPAELLRARFTRVSRSAARIGLPLAGASID